MKKLSSIIVIFLLFTVLTAICLADNAEMRLVVSKNDGTVNGDFFVDLELRITDGGTPKTLNSLTADVYYGPQLTEWDSNPATDWGPNLGLGYTFDADKLTGYYRVTITGGNVKPGVASGWDVTKTWGKVVTLRWKINTASSVDVSISDDTDAAAYFNNYHNDPADNATSWNVSNQDLTDVSLPVQLSSFSAEAGDGNILLKWRTESEENNLGFYIYRSLLDSTGYHRINSSIVPGAGNSSAYQDYSYTDFNVEKGITYFYKLESIDFAGNSQFTDFISAKIDAFLVSPVNYSLQQNFPNPFNPVTEIKYQIPEDSYVEISIFNLLGQKLLTLVHKKVDAGYYSVIWDGTDKNGNAMGAGVYLVKLITNNFQDYKKMILLK